MVTSSTFPSLMADNLSDNTLELNQSRQKAHGSSVGINIPEMNLSIKAYPNPVTSHVNLEMNAHKAMAIDIRIYNVRGEELEVPMEEKQRESCIEFVWDFDQYAHGIYFLNFQTKNGQQLKTIKVQKTY